MPEQQLPPYALDGRHLAEPVNAFDWMVARLRSWTYDTQEQLDVAKKSRAWFEHLAKAIPQAKHNDPLMMAAICRAALNGSDRKWLDDMLRAVETEVVAHLTPDATKAAPAPTNGHGLRMD